VCNPRKNALLKDGNKSDRIDARKLAELLRGNQLSTGDKSPLRSRSPLKIAEWRTDGASLCYRLVSSATNSTSRLLLKSTSRFKEFGPKLPVFDLTSVAIGLWWK
jgi:hypothetical protein